MQLRRIVSLTAAFQFVVALVTSVVLYVVPQGRVAYWSDWRWLGLSKEEWGAVHIVSGTLFLAAMALHLYYNWKPFTAYLKDKARRLRFFTPDCNVALVLTVAAIVCTLAGIPPFSWVMDLNTWFKDQAAQQYGEPPYGHAELSSLKGFAPKTGLDLADAMARLRAANIAFDGESDTILHIAEANDLSPSQVFDFMRPPKQEGAAASAGTGLPESPPAGFGRKTLDQIGAEFDVSVQNMTGALQRAGIRAAPDRPIKEIAAEAGKDPLELFEMLRTAVAP